VGIGFVIGHLFTKGNESPRTMIRCFPELRGDRILFSADSSRIRIHNLTVKYTQVLDVWLKRPTAGRMIRGVLASPLLMYLMQLDPLQPVG
jgi:hypothetical protein